MDFFVNSQKIDITIENEKTIGDILKAFEKEFEANNATTTGISLDGKAVGADEFDAVFEKSLSDFSKLELSIITLAEIKEAIEAEAKESLELAEKIKDISVAFQSGKDKEAAVLIANLADFINSICTTIKKTAYFPDAFKSLQKENGKSIEDFFAEITPILADLQQAIESNDTVLVGDLAEYEISPRLVSISEILKKI
ncbi:MAG: hypothetical protein K6B43_01450 [Treponema sp.]|nr:hypothetical protein [Treponema sp.]